jgi:hypothetical protein
LGCPTYITSCREEDLPGRSVAGMRTRTFAMLDAAYAAGVDPADCQRRPKIPNYTNKIIMAKDYGGGMADHEDWTPSEVASTVANPFYAINIDEGLQ